jgi:hypothetical protein
MCNQCMDGFALVSGACVACPGGCAYCSDPNSCEGCWDGQFLDYSNGYAECMPCIGGCSSCTSSTDCVSCYDGMYYNADM